MAKDMTFKEFEKYLENTASGITDELSKTIELCCQKVRSDIQYSMAHTERDMSKTYHGNHHPSKPGNPPAPDTGNLRDSINYEINAKSKEVFGVVGSIQKDPNYAEWMEYGNSENQPRPWLRPAMIKNNDWIRKSVAQAVARSMSKGGN